MEAVVSLCSDPGDAGADSLNSHGFSVSSIKARWIFRYKCVSQCTPHQQLLAFLGKGHRYVFSMKRMAGFSGGTGIH
jgi:hypothetical protein